MKTIKILTTIFLLIAAFNTTTQGQDDVEILFKSGVSEYESGNYVKAENIFSRLVNDNSPTRETAK